MEANYCRFLRSNTTIEGDDNALLHRRLLLLLKHKEKGNISAIVAFFATITPQKKMMTHCRRLFLLKHREEGDGNKLPSPFSLQHHRRRQWCITIVFFFSNTEKTKHARKQPKKPKEGKELTFKLLLYPFIFGSHFYPPASAFLLLSFHFKHFLLATTSALLFLALSSAFPVLPS